MVQLLINVRDEDLAMTCTSTRTQKSLVVQLLAAATHNQEETWAALTNFHQWRFFQVVLFVTTSARLQCGTATHCCLQLCHV